MLAPFVLRIGMSQPAKDTQSEPIPAKKRRRVHKRTIAVVLCVVIFPWALIAIPGTLSTGDEVSGLNIYHLLHGWPFVHLESTHYHQNVGNSEIGRYRLGRLPLGADVAKSAKEAAAIFTQDRSSAQLNLRLEKDPYRSHWLGKLGFWSDGSNWSILKSGVHLTPRYFGMLLNLFCIALLAAIVAALSELKIRRHGGLLKYSLANLLIGITVIAVACAWITGIHLDHTDQAQLDDQLQALSEKRFSDNNELFYFSKSHESRFPLVISQLLNHGKHPWGALPYFRQVKTGHVLVRIEKESDIDRLKKIKSLVSANKYSVELDLHSYTPETQKMLNTLDGVNLVSLKLSFGGQQASSYIARASRRKETETDLARVQASQARSSLVYEKTQEDYKELFQGLDNKNYAKLKAIFPAKKTPMNQRLDEQRLAEQKNESQTPKFKTGPFIGIYMEKLKDEDGVRISRIINNSPADLADLRIDDVILKIDDEVATSPQFLAQTLVKYKSSDHVALKVRRGDKEMRIKLTLADRNKFGPDSGSKADDWVKKLEKMIAADVHPKTREARRTQPRVYGAVLALLDRKINQSGFKVDIDIDISKLESLELNLEPMISQVEQLQPFVGLPSLKTANISGLSTEGAEFILSTKEQWPEDMILEFYNDDWLRKEADELRLRQWQNDANK